MFISSFSLHVESKLGGLIFELQRRFHRWPLHFDDFLAEVREKQTVWKGVWEMRGCKPQAVERLCFLSPFKFLLPILYIYIYIVSYMYTTLQWHFSERRNCWKHAAVLKMDLLLKMRNFDVDVRDTVVFSTNRILGFQRHSAPWEKNMCLWHLPCVEGILSQHDLYLAHDIGGNWHDNMWVCYAISAPLC